MSGDARTRIPGFRPADGLDERHSAEQIRGSTTILEILRMYPDGRAARLMSRIYWPCAHCGGAVREPLTMAALRHGRDPRAVLQAFRALDGAGPTDDQVALAAAQQPR